MKDKAEQKKKMAKAYEAYAQQFTPKASHFKNCCKAFVIGGAICVGSLWAENILANRGVSEKDAQILITVALIMTAQLLTGIGVFDSLTKFAGAGVIVPITGFANSMVAPAIEYKKEGLILGVGGKLFSLAGPVLVCGISSASAVGLIYWIVGKVW